ncbi:MAG TPA: 6-phosphogluconolactonase [Acidimicrobiales bacterium]|nr:6-phosphogluconolactonase [Acidimicrobiales bacterium]
MSSGSAEGGAEVAPAAGTAAPGPALAGEVRVLADPPAAYAAIVLEEVTAKASGSGSSDRAGGVSFRVAVSGGASGEACMHALIAAQLPWRQIELFFADERCVPEDAPQSNAGSLRAVLGEHAAELAGFYPMSCEEGPGPYEERLRSGGLDLVQLGFGPDGHLASLFPGSPGLAAPAGSLVVTNNDVTGRNPLERMTLTLEGIALAGTVVIVVSGAEKHDALARILDGEQLPAARVRARRLIWLIDEAATSGLRERLGSS